MNDHLCLEFCQCWNCTRAGDHWVGNCIVNNIVHRSSLPSVYVWFWSTCLLWSWTMSDDCIISHGCQSLQWISTLATHFISRAFGAQFTTLVTTATTFISVIRLAVKSLAVSPIARAIPCVTCTCMRLDALMCVCNQLEEGDCVDYVFTHEEGSAKLKRVRVLKIEDTGSPDKVKIYLRVWRSPQDPP